PHLPNLENVKVTVNEIHVEQLQGAHSDDRRQAELASGDVAGRAVDIGVFRRLPATLPMAQCVAECLASEGTLGARVYDGARSDSAYPHFDSQQSVVRQRGMNPAKTVGGHTPGRLGDGHAVATELHQDPL